MLSGFTKWLTSVDGGEKPPMQINKDKHIVLSVVRHNNNEAIYHKYLACLSFLNNWMTKLNKEKKEPGYKSYKNVLKISQTLHRLL